MTTDTMTPAERIDAVSADLGISMTTEFVPWSQSRNKGEKSPSLNWNVTLQRNGHPFLTTDYMAGSGHAPSYKPRTTLEENDAIIWECENGRHSFTKRPLKPDLRDVLYSLASDASVLDCSGFEDWASDLGYDTDSRKAEAIYRACLEIALKLRNTLGEDGLARLREATQDY